MENVLNDLLTLNLPVGYVLTGLAVIGAVFLAAKKVVSIATGLFSRISLAFTTSFLMFLAGSTGVGYSTSEISSRTTEPVQEENQAIVLTNQDLIKLAQNQDVDQAKLDFILAYAKERDAAFLKNGKIDLITVASLPNLEVAEPQPVVQDAQVPIAAVGSILGMSIAMLISSAIVFFYKIVPPTIR